MSSENLSKIIDILIFVVEDDLELVAEFVQRYMHDDPKTIEAAEKLLELESEAELIKRLFEL